MSTSLSEERQNLYWTNWIFLSHLRPFIGIQKKSVCGSALKERQVSHSGWMICNHNQSKRTGAVRETGESKSQYWSECSRKKILF